MDRRIPLGLKVGAAVAALIVGSIGLAYAAGVELPGRSSDEAAESTAAVEKTERDEVETQRRMGSRRGETGSVSDAVREVIEDREEGGCEFGQAVAEAVRANSQGDDAGAEDPCAHDGSGSAAGALGESKDRDAKSHDPKGGRDTGHERSAKAADPQVEDHDADDQEAVESRNCREGHVGVRRQDADQ